MRSPPLPLLLLLALTVAVDVVVYWTISHASGGELIIRVFYTALLAGQAALVASWFTLGGTNFLVRLAAIVGGVILVSQTLTTQVRLERFHLVSIVELILAIVFTGVLRVLGFQWLSTHRSTEDIDGYRVRQYALRELLGWTAGIAVIMVAVRQSMPHFGDQVFQLTSLLLVSGSLAGLSLLPLTLARPHVQVLLRLALVLLAAAIVGGLFGAGLGSEEWALVAYFVTASLFESVWILTARACGYRLLRSQRRAAVDMPKPPEIDPWSDNEES